MGQKTVLGQLACLLQSIHCFIDAEKEVEFAGGVVFTKESEKRWVWSAKVVVSQVNRPKEGVRGDDRV